MVFSSFSFLIVFLPLVLISYYLVPRILKNLVLLLFSLIFYAWGEPSYIFLMIGSISVNYILAIKINQWQEDKKVKAAKGMLGFAVAANVLLLAFFKYGSNFWGFPLPIGISFYTFQTMSYVIDVYRKEVKVQRNLLDLGTYVSMFPQLVAGPIVRYQQIEMELKNRKETMQVFAQGIQRFCVGLGKKVLLANTMGRIFIDICNVSVDQQSIALLWLGMIAFTFQIYFDFSGYSDMAIGLGNMFGFQFNENFNYPYISKSITEFWRRWHISLSTWFRDYLYIPLGGNKNGLKQQIRNIFIVWMLTGIWHGASINFVLWGLYFGVILTIEKLFWGKYLVKLPSFFQHSYALFLIVLGWVLFAFENGGDLILRLKQLFGAGGLPFYSEKLLYYVVSYGAIFLICILGSTPCFKNKIGKWWLILFVLSIGFLAADSYNPFLYFRF